MKFIMSILTLLVSVQDGYARYDSEAARLYDVGLRALAHGEQEKAQIALEEAVTVDSTLADGHYVLGLIYQGAEKFYAAVNAFRRAIVADTDYIEAYCELGEVLLIQLGNPAKAMAVLQKAVALNSEHARARTLLGIAYFREHQLDDALKALQRAIKLNPISQTAYDTLGLVLLEKEEWNAAISVLQKLLELNRFHATAHFSLGTAYRRIGKITEARETLHRFEVLSIEDEQLRHIERYVQQEPNDATGWYELGRFALNRQQWEQARVALERYVSLDSKAIRGYEMLGYLYFQQQDYSQALSLYQNVIQHKPDVATYRNSLGGVYVMLKRYPEAIEQYETAIRLEPSEARFYLNISEAYRLSGESVMAESAYQVYERLKSTPQ